MSVKNQPVIRRTRKRPASSCSPGVQSSYEDRDQEYLCPVCFDTIDEAYMTKCGHSFCYRCIRQSLDHSNRCPRCNSVIEKKDDIFPNFSLNELIVKQRQRQNERKKLRTENQIASGASASNAISSLLNDELDIGKVNSLLQLLAKKKEMLEEETKLTELKLLAKFLQILQGEAQEKYVNICKEVKFISSDLSQVELLISGAAQTELGAVGSERTVLDVIDDVGMSAADADFKPRQGGFNGSRHVGSHLTKASLSTMVTRIHQHMDDLRQCYFAFKQRDSLSNGTGKSQLSDDSVASSVNDGSNSNSVTATTGVTNSSLTVLLAASGSSNLATDATVASSSSASAADSATSSSFALVAPIAMATAATGSTVTIKVESNSSEDVGNFGDSLTEFHRHLSKFVRYNSFRTLSSLNYANDIYSTSSIVSSIEFDKDCEFFAIAGVTKKIKLFEYDSVVTDQVDVHFPVIEMLCNSKISCVSWNCFHKGMLASSDYEGTVTLWDAFTGEKNSVFQEHEKRCWSVDFNCRDPKMLASGSDDSKVKLWYTNMEHSVAYLEAKANVCCVKFSPDNTYNLAFGSADHCVHYYDIRNTKQPLAVFKGHRKAVSYTKFLSSSMLVSASTDSQLKLWDLTKNQCVRTFRGHVNEKNFVGLATDSDYIACGSESNSLYVYYHGLSKPLMTYKFETVRSILSEKEKKDDEINEFVSAACWKDDTNVLLAANSQGVVKVLELV